MDILAIAREVAPVIGVNLPDAVFGVTDRTALELAALANEMAERIATAYPWQLFQTVATYTGDGATEAFDLPADYHWMTDEAQVWSSSLQTPFSRLRDVNEWLELDVNAFDLVVNAWIIFGGQVHFKPALGTGVTAKFFYQSKTYIRQSASIVKDAFDTDTDEFRLDDRMLRLGMVWQWKANKGRAYAEDMANFEEAKARQIMRDKGAKKLIVGTRRLRHDATVAYPIPIVP